MEPSKSSFPPASYNNRTGFPEEWIPCAQGSTFFAWNLTNRKSLTFAVLYRFRDRTHDPGAWKPLYPGLTFTVRMSKLRSLVVGEPRAHVQALRAKGPWADGYSVSNSPITGVRKALRGRTAIQGLSDRPVLRGLSFHERQNIPRRPTRNAARSDDGMIPSDNSSFRGPVREEPCRRGAPAIA